MADEDAAMNGAGEPDDGDQTEDGPRSLRQRKKQVSYAEVDTDEEDLAMARSTMHELLRDAQRR